MTGLEVGGVGEGGDKWPCSGYTLLSLYNLGECDTGVELGQAKYDRISRETI